MYWKDVNPYIRFCLGVILGVGTFIGIWMGSDYSLSKTPEEIVIRVVSVLYFPTLYGIVSWFLIVYVVRPIFVKKFRTAEPHFFVAGLSATLSLIVLVLMIINPTNIPLLGDLK